MPGWLAVLCLLSACKRTEPPVGTPPAASPTTASPSAERDATTQFWSWFQAEAPRLLADKDLRRVMKEINDHLEPKHRGVFVEVGDDKQGRRLVISSDGKKELFPVVQEVYTARPAVPGWNIVAFRQRDRETFVIEMSGLKLDPRLMKVATEREEDKLSIVVFVPNLVRSKEMLQALYIVLDHTIGEYDMETRIGGIDFEPIEKASPDAKPLSDLPKIIDKTLAP